MKIYSIIAILIAMFLFTGCCTKLPPEQVITIETKIVKVPVPCEVPKLNCDFKGDGFVPTTKLLECLIQHKRALEVCSNKNIK